MPKLTVVILTNDDRQHLAGCVESIRPIAHEILVADGGSRDGTPELARQLQGCTVVELSDASPTSLEQRAVAAAAYDWVLVIHACERVTPELAAEIRELLASTPQRPAYALARESYFLGYPVPHCRWHEPNPVRLMHRGKRRSPLPATRGARGRSERTGRLNNAILHYAALDLDRFLARLQRDATWAALDAHDAGKRTTWLKMAARAPLTFLRRYVWNRGFLDGRAGLMVCGIQAWYAFLRDCKQWELQHSRARFDPPRRFQLRFIPPPTPAPIERDAS